MTAVALTEIIEKADRVVNSTVDNNGGLAGCIQKMAGCGNPYDRHTALARNKAHGSFNSLRMEQRRLNSDSGNHDDITRLVGPGPLGNATLITIRNNNRGFSTLHLDGSAGSIGINRIVSATYRNCGIFTIENLAGTHIFKGNIQIKAGRSINETPV
jgi:hypothetical protein